MTHPLLPGDLDVIGYPGRQTGLDLLEEIPYSGEVLTGQPQIACRGEARDQQLEAALKPLLHELELSR